MAQAAYYFLSTGGVGYTPDGTVPEGAIICTQEQYQNSQNYFISSTTTPPTIQPVSAATTLELLQAAKIMALAQSCSNAIYAGYYSSALGASYLYPSKATDQLNMISSLMSAVGSVIFDCDPWEANTELVEGQMVWVKKQLYTVVQGGTTGSQVPQWPMTAGATVNDGSVIWNLWTTLFWCADTNGEVPVWEFRPHTLRQIWQVGKDAKLAILNSMGTNIVLGDEVESATTAAQVSAITWPAAS